MKAFQAYAKGNRITRETPRSAATGFFEAYPNRRKCDVIEGSYDGTFFTVAYCRENWPQSWKDVTKKTAKELPDATL